MRVCVYVCVCGREGGGGGGVAGTERRKEEKTLHHVVLNTQLYFLDVCACASARVRECIGASARAHELTEAKKQSCVLKTT